MDLGIAFEKFVRNQAIKYAGVEVAKQTALHAFFGKHQPPPDAIVWLSHTMYVYSCGGSSSNVDEDCRCCG